MKPRRHTPPGLFLIPELLKPEELNANVRRPQKQSRTLPASAPCKRVEAKTGAMTSMSSPCVCVLRRCRGRTPCGVRRQGCRRPVRPASERRHPSHRRAGDNRPAARVLRLKACGRRPHDIATVLTGTDSCRESREKRSDASHVIAGRQCFETVLRKNA